ncbi:hypothetical protein Bca52824_056274 [Brassica carinata]|uniref:Prolamin-like domain-containing protein n=1 Tax=Brassica carinata TaxID=52824 RepID=A0A8X7UCM5_BRACI|nr:hypothetical protein Bca52824_056274 [Brassica carinata]
MKNLCHIQSYSNRTRVINYPRALLIAALTSLSPQATLAVPWLRKSLPCRSLPTNSVPSATGSHQMLERQEGGRKAAIGSECCAAIKKMNKDCEKTVFGSFHDPFLTGYKTVFGF